MQQQESARQISGQSPSQPDTIAPDGQWLKSAAEAHPALLPTSGQDMVYLTVTLGFGVREGPEVRFA